MTLLRKTSNTTLFKFCSTNKQEVLEYIHDLVGKQTVLILAILITAWILVYCIFEVFSISFNISINISRLNVLELLLRL